MGRLLDEDIVIDALIGISGSKSIEELTEECEVYQSDNRCWSGGVYGAIRAIKALPPIQPEKAQLSQEDATSDMISKTGTVDNLRRMLEATVTNTDYDEGFVDGIEFAISTASTMPTIQPQSTTGQLNDGVQSTVQSTDLIDRQAAIDLVTDMDFMNYTAKGILRDSLRKLSPAQPELNLENLVRMIEFGITATNSRDAYSLGMRNGMRWCKSLIDGAEPKFEDDVMSVDDGKELPTIQPEKAQLSKESTTSDTISRQAALNSPVTMVSEGLDWIPAYHIKELPSAQPEQLERCPIYDGVCGYPSDQCYDCPRHHGAQPELTYEQVEEYCKRRCLHVVTADFFESTKPQRLGHWILYDKRFPWRTWYKCSECGNYLDFSGVNGGRAEPHFCPNCGAKMRGEQE